MLRLNVVCHGDDTMDVTSHHLEIVPHEWPSEGGGENSNAEEVSKRGELFGKPVGKGEYLSSFSKNHKHEGTVR